MVGAVGALWRAARGARPVGCRPFCRSLATSFPRVDKAGEHAAVGTAFRITTGRLAAVGLPRAAVTDADAFTPANTNVGIAMADAVIAACQKRTASSAVEKILRRYGRREGFFEPALCPAR